jgi:PAS domain-containing protein
VKKGFIIISILTVSVAQTSAQSDVLINKKKITNVITNSTYFIDKTGHRSFNDLIKIPSSEFQTSINQILVLPISSSATWIKFHAVNLTHEKAYLRVDNPTADTVQLFYFDPQKSSFASKIYGYNLPMEERAVKSTGIIFELPYCGSKGADYYLRVVSRKTIYLPISAGNINPLMEDVLLNYTLDALYFGMIFVMIFFNLIIAISFKSRSYFIYIGCLVFVGLFMFYWKGYTLFWPAVLKFFISNYSNSIAAIAIIFSILFAIYFLKVEDFSKKLYNYCLILIAINLPIIFFEVIGNKFIAVNIQILVIPLISTSLIIISAYIYYKGLKHARFYLLASGLYQISLIIFLLPIYNLMPFPKFHSHIIPIGHALDIILLAVALADRINQLRNEKEKILKGSLEQQKELNEQLLTREEDLAASENELKNANQQLHVLNQDLIDKNGQLIDNQIKLFSSLEEARVLNNKLSSREEELTTKEEELRQSLDELSLTYKQLKESERMLRLAQTIAKTGSWTFHVKTGEFEFSEPLYDLLEIPHGTPLTKELMVEILGEQVIEDSYHKISESIISKESFHIEYKLFLKDGQVRHMQTIGTPFKDEKGEITEIYGSTQDISEIRKAEELLKKQTSELIESNKKTAEYKLLALRSVMNPHFLFNSLNSIQYFITKNDREQALTYLAMFSKLIRSILSSSIANYNSLSEEIEILKLYVNLESLRFMNKFKTEFEIDHSLRNEEILIPSLLLQPYIENAIIHGLFHKKGNDGLLKITFRKKGNKVLCIVEDNGIGRKSALEIKNANNLHKSIGMLVTKERIDLINNDDQVSVVITDLFDSQNLPTGTKVEVLVAYQKNI